MFENHSETFSHQQLDWRWINRYRQLISYNLSFLWAQAGPFIEEEQKQWMALITKGHDETGKALLNTILVASRDRELQAALSEQREPYFSYPVLTHYLEDVTTRIHKLEQLDSEIQQDEQNPIVKRLYHNTIKEQITFLHLLETTAKKDNHRYKEITNLLYPSPTHEEMQYPFEQLKKMLLQGLRYNETIDISKSLINYIGTHLQMNDFITKEEIAHEQKQQTALPTMARQKTVSAQKAKHFFEQVLQEAGYTTWSVVIDSKASGASVQPSVKQLQLSTNPLTIAHVNHLLAHEIAGHIARSVAGEQSGIGLLAIGTAGYLMTEEGFALYNEAQMAIRHNEQLDYSGMWIDMLSVGLACGVGTPPQTYTKLFTFFALLFTLHRLLNNYDTDVKTVQEQAKKRAFTRCLRTFRGVPDLTQSGIAYTKDVVYLRGLRAIEQAVKEDKTVVTRLTVGKIALEYLSDISELVIPAPSPFVYEKYRNYWKD